MARFATLWLAAALISGFTMRRYLEPFDEGFLLQAATRMAEGQWPYRDFGWPYGPGQASVIALAFKTFGPSVVWWRVLRVVADATVALLVYALSRREAGERWALAGWLAAAVTVAQPTSANPFPVALAFALAAVLAAAHRRPAAAGVLVALTAAWRLDLGAATLLAAAIAAHRGAGRRVWAGATRSVSTRPPPSGGRQRPALARGGHPQPVVNRRRSFARERPAATVAVVAAVAVVVVFLPFAVAAGPGRLYDELIATAAGDGGWWRLPFPVFYDGPLAGWPPRAFAEDAKDLLGYELPLIAALGTVLAGVALALRRRIPPEAAGLLVLAAGCGAYLLSRPDELHVQPLAVCLCALVPITAAAAHGKGRAALRVALTAVLGLVLLAGAANRLSALLLPPDLEPVHLPGVPGIRVPPAEAEALPPMVARVQQLVPPGEPIYVAPRRSDLVTLTNPLVHFLTRRPNVLRRDVIVQARPEEQARIVAALRRAPPRAIVRWTDPLSSRVEPNARGRPSGSRVLDEYLGAEYRLDRRFGAYDVLVPR